MKLIDILTNKPTKVWEDKGYILPKFDIQVVRDKTFSEPTWIHFGAGNIFRAFPAALLQKILETGAYDRGVVVAAGYDYEVIDKAYRPYDNLNLLVTLGADGSMTKRVIASVTESLKADYQFEGDWVRLKNIFQNPSLQMVSFSITEKGYVVPSGDLDRGLTPEAPLGKVTVLLHKRFEAGKYPITLQSMDNCSRNGDVVKNAVYSYAKAWIEAGLVSGGFLEYLSDEKVVSFPWSMIDKITPYPDAAVQKLLEADGFADAQIVRTIKGSNTSAFINAEETEYMVLEDNYPAGRPPLELGGVIFTDREKVAQIEKMKVCTCLNPLHTALAIFGCLLGYDRICDEMRDEDLVELITKMAYNEAMPVVVDPGIIRPEDFLEAVIKKRLPNPFMPDAPQRIATDTSQKLPIRFGETIKAYVERGMDVKALALIPLTLAAYARYLRGVDDAGEPFTPSPDPKLEELSSIVSELKLTSAPQDMSRLHQLFSRCDIFGLDLYEVGLGDKIEAMTSEFYSGTGAVRETLRKYLRAL
ncbi:MAG: mannitol dehydrogenase family protein [Oscillospiraceae bacterium]|nr:mannitol dehydrogenase family protein [Oscillospiraceae bacterium]